MSWSQEPWSTEQCGNTIQILSGDKIITTLKEGAIYGGQTQDAARITACVNACRGISDQLLQQVINGDLEIHFAPPFNGVS